MARLARLLHSLQDDTGSKIVEFSVYHHSRFTLYLSEPDPSKREEAVWTQIDPAFSEPTTPADNAADYVPTQVIAELFKNEGFDGIAYKSAFEKKGLQHRAVRSGRRRADQLRPVRGRIPQVSVRAVGQPLLGRRR